MKAEALSERPKLWIWTDISSSILWRRTIAEQAMLNMTNIIAGYKPVRETEGAGLAAYTETEEEILQSWSGKTNSDGEDHITALELAVCELYELIEGVLKNGENLL